MIDTIIAHTFTTTVNLNLNKLVSNRNKFWAAYTYVKKDTEGCYPVNIITEEIYD